MHKWIFDPIDHLATISMHLAGLKHVLARVRYTENPKTENVQFTARLIRVSEQPRGSDAFEVGLNIS
jgi:hypothetical protein